MGNHKDLDGGSDTKNITVIMVTQLIMVHNKHYYSKNLHNNIHSKYTILKKKCFNLYSKNLHNNVHSKYTIFRKMLQSFTRLTYIIFSKKIANSMNIMIQIIYITLYVALAV